ncbi:ABC transporter permease [Ahrensia kielensis]|uniref:ABC transporter permease n=1 Tax=Ahrensia kielensis TaxID=76980 RepID=UPI00036C2C10|nr:ABC transporter permease [Ahrensia kielensis]
MSFSSKHAEPDQPRSVMQKLLDWKEAYPDAASTTATAFILLALLAIFYGVNERFISLLNISIILNQTAAYIILGVGMTLVIAIKGIDLSIGSIVAVSGMMLGLLLVNNDFPVWFALIAAVAAGSLCGVANGYCVANLRVPALIVTLGTMIVFRGVALIVLGHDILFRYPDALLWIARGRILGLAPSVYLAALVVILGFVMLNYTSFGKRVIAVGGNEEAARLSGINIRRVKFTVYVLMGALSGVAAIVWVARLNSTQASVATGIEFHVIALVVLGGTSLFGGRGLIIGSLLGALILGILENGLGVTGFSSFMQQTVLGLIFIGVVALRSWQARRADP